MKLNNFYYLQFLDDKRLRAEVDKVSLQAILEKTVILVDYFPAKYVCILEFQTILSDDLPNKTQIIYK